MSTEQDLIRQRIADGRRRTQGLYEAEQQRLRDAAQLAADKEAKRKVLEQEEWEMIKPLIAPAIQEACDPSWDRFQEGACSSFEIYYDRISVHVAVPKECVNISQAFISQQLLALGVADISSSFSYPGYGFFSFRISHTHRFPDTDWGRKLQETLASSRQIHTDKYVAHLKEHIIKKLGEVTLGEACDIMFYSASMIGADSTVLLLRSGYLREKALINQYLPHIQSYLIKIFPAAEYNMAIFNRVESKVDGFSSHRVCNYYLRITQKLAPRAEEPHLPRAVVSSTLSESSVARTMVLSAASASSISTVGGARPPVTHAYPRDPKARSAAPSLYAEVKERCTGLFRSKK